MMIRRKRILLTSNNGIKECFPESQDYEPLERRFKQHHYSVPFKK